MTKEEPITIKYLRRKFGIGAILPELSIIIQFLDELDGSTRTDFCCSFDEFAANICEFKNSYDNQCSAQEIEVLDNFAEYIADDLREEF